MNTGKKKPSNTQMMIISKASREANKKPDTNSTVNISTSQRKAAKTKKNSINAEPITGSKTSNFPVVHHQKAKSFAYPAHDYNSNPLYGQRQQQSGHKQGVPSFSHAFSSKVNIADAQGPKQKFSMPQAL